MFGLTTTKKLRAAQQEANLLSDELTTAWNRCKELERKVRDLTVQASVALDNDKLKAMAKWEVRHDS
jgi:hypothetical protein